MSQKILLPTPDFPPQRGGVARYLEAIKKTFPDEVRVLYRPNLPSRGDLYKLIKSESEGVDALWVSHILPLGTTAMFLSLTKKLPYTIFLHGMDFDLARRTFLRRLTSRVILNLAEHIVVNSRALAIEVKEFCGRKDALVVYPVISDEFLEESEVEKKKLKKGNSKNVNLLTVSRLVERKGHLKVLEAIKDMENVSYQIVGDGPCREKIISKIKELKLENRVKIFTDINDDRLFDFYRDADIFVMPTSKSKLDREGFGIVYLEAQLFKLPVVATKHPGVDEAVIDKGTGLLIEDHPDALLFAIKRLVTDKDLREKMGVAGREFVRNGFTREKQFKKLAEIL